jgi:conjugal transfer pilus assembly protein TraV
MNKKLIAASFLLSLMTGCSQYASDFDCPYGTGMGCASLSTVNKSIDSHELDISSDLNGIASLRNSKTAMIYFGKDRMGKLIKIDSPDL